MKENNAPLAQRKGGLRGRKHTVSVFTDGKRWWARVRYDAGTHTVVSTSESGVWHALAHSLSYYLTETH